MSNFFDTENFTSHHNFRLISAIENYVFLNTRAWMTKKVVLEIARRQLFKFSGHFR